MNIPPLAGRSLAVAWIETLFSVAWAVGASLLVPLAESLPVLAGLVAMTFVALVVAALSGMYAVTRSPSPWALSLCRYGCAVGALVAFFAL